MLIHTTLVGKKRAAGELTHINARATPSDHFVRSSVKRVRSNYPVEYDHSKTELENHIECLRRYCNANGLFDTTWVYTQETTFMYRFTEALPHNWVNVPKPAPLVPAPPPPVPAPY